ncbi:helix-turn-helix domain-containing protein [Streptomyces sp. P9(2023)]|uniref:helix-turn-helix domain-containing protein n=1 Tax=Streptomyces sp. P9(2023) TaxID=3064394 RepID=UPI0028F43C1B|nr:helix-turn-helix domain-containing protein [Streptomyces sp. P9(2023)]MDT9693210.1 helix-turn-helix domain-containing protein [Streptomyces sp. P9(2023)]
MSKHATGTRTGSEQALAVYLELRARPASDSGSGTAFEDVADGLGLSADERLRCRAELTALGLITDVTDTATHTVVEPDTALVRLLQRERDRLEHRLAETSRAQATLATLAGPFLRAGAAPRSEVDVEVVADTARVRQELAALTDAVRTSVHSMHTGSVRREDMADELARDCRWAARGVRVHAMYSRRISSVPDMAQHLEERAALGVEIRLSPVVPMNMVLADENFALLPTDPHDPDSATILARGPGLVRSYLSLYAYCWQAAGRYGDEEKPERGGDGLSEQQRAALRMLASGIKDEQIAKNLGVSLRTVSRLLSEVMQELGAASRFEAGVKAARIGLLDGEADA